MDIQAIEASLLNPAAYNPRRDLKPGDKEYEKLKRSIEEFGYVEPIIWNRRTGNIVGGHQRFKVMQDLGFSAVDCVVVDLNEAREKALNIALNKVQGDWDEDKLAAIMADFEAADFDVSLTGFDAPEVDALLDKFYSKEAVQDDFDIDKAKAEVEASGGVITKPGDIWLLGNHRLMCADSTDPANFEKLMDGQRAQLCITSPPYGVGKEYETAGIEPWFATMRPVIKNLTKYADIICWNLADLLMTKSQYIEPTNAYCVTMFAEQGYRPLWIRVWDKIRQPLSTPAPFHLTTNKPVDSSELITAFGKPEENAGEINESDYAFVTAFGAYSYKFVKRLTKEERRDWGYSPIWKISSLVKHKDHPAAYPVELPWRCIKMHSDKGAAVLEPFSGSGTTIIACEQTDRACYAMELSPEYCDVAVKRWEQFTGEKATLLQP
jgi:DNA modification methylase